MMKKSAVLADSDRSLLPGKPELRINVDRERAADRVVDRLLGVDAERLQLAKLFQAYASVIGNFPGWRINGF
jgi:hypothetical protein